MKLTYKTLTHKTRIQKQKGEKGNQDKIRGRKRRGRKDAKEEDKPTNHQFFFTQRSVLRVTQTLDVLHPKIAFFLVLQYKTRRAA